MEYKWSDSLKIGDELVDGQHKELIRMFNNLLAACASDKKEAEKNKEIKELLDFLCLYTVQHFADEEDLQVKCEFPGYEEHRAMHEEFKLKAFDLCKKFEGWGYSYKLASILRAQIGQWLVDHIQQEDKKISEYLK